MVNKSLGIKLFSINLYIVFIYIKSLWYLPPIFATSAENQSADYLFALQHCPQETILWGGNIKYYENLCIQISGTGKTYRIDDSQFWIWLLPSTSKMKYSGLSRCSTARGDISGICLGGPTKVKACKYFLFTEPSLKVENKEHLSWRVP